MNFNYNQSTGELTIDGETYTLKGCPFCGERPDFDHEVFEESDLMSQIYCDNNKCIRELEHIEFGPDSEHLKKLIEIWNRRHP